MANRPTQPDETLATLPVSASRNAAEALLKARALDTPPKPGLLGSLDRFEILEIIGQGGMRVVLLARDPATDTLVAMRMLRPELSREPQIVKRFLTEAKHLYKLDHVGILRVLEVSDRIAGPYYVMLYKERGSLARLIQPGEPLDKATTLAIARQVAEALAFAHAQGLIQLDVKPHNILLDADGRANLADFGLVRTVFNDSLIEPGHEGRLGTIAYMSPAVARGEAEDTRCDIYSFGAVMYEMLTGEPPYTGQTREAVLNAVLAGPPVPVRTRDPEAPTDLATVCEGCMARELRDRYATMGDGVRDLALIADGKSPLGPHGRARSVHSRRVRHLVATGATAATILIGIGYAVLTRPARRPVSAAVPRLLQTGPTDGAPGVDSTLTALRSYFDQSMSDQFTGDSEPGYSYPAYGDAFVDDSGAVVQRAVLEPGRLYRVRFPAKSAAGVFSEWHTLTFRTRAGPPPPTDVLCVDRNAKGANNGHGWHDACVDLRDALEVATKSDGAIREIWLPREATSRTAAPAT